MQYKCCCCCSSVFIQISGSHASNSNAKQFNRTPDIVYLFYLSLKIFYVLYHYSSFPVRLRCECVVVKLQIELLKWMSNVLHCYSGALLTEFDELSLDLILEFS
uniref:Uncharacterized protein n=1 Tax=Glossina brevipalpis TaxID=37001 RepID=A0A1A9WUM8_9MUSC